jgi:PAS domain S-box-containing protein
VPKVPARARGVLSSVRPRLRFTEWAIVLVSLSVGAMAATSLVALHQGGDEAREAQLLVARMATRVESLERLLLRADRGPVREDERQLRALLAELGRIDSDDRRLAPLRRLVATLERRIDGAYAGASAASAHPAFEQVRAELVALGADYDGRASHAVRIAALGSTGAVLAAVMLVGLIALALSRRRAARERAGEAERMRLIRLVQAVAASSNAAATLDEALAAALRQICEHTGWPLGHVYLLDENGAGELVSAGIVHLEGDRDRFGPFLADTENRRFRAGEGLPGRVLAERRPLWITAAASRSGGMHRARVAQQVGIRSAFAFPVALKDRVVAVLEFFSPHEVEPDEPLLEAMAHAGFQLGYLLERKRAETELRETEARYRTLVEQLPLATYIDGPAGLGSTTYLSPQIEEMSGYAPAEFLADRELFQRLLHPDDRERVVAAIVDATANGEPVQQEYRVLARDGSVRWWRDAAVPVRDERGEPVYRQGYVVDVTERRAAEERLREAERRYRVLVEHLPLVTYIDEADALCTSIYISPQIETTLGYPREAWADPSFFPSILHPEDRDWVLAEHERAYTAHLEMALEYRVLHRDGHPVWFRDQMTIVRDDDGGARFVQGYMLDITERKASEERLAVAERRYRTLVEQLPLATYIDRLDETSSAIYMSPQIEAMLGYSPEEWLADPALFPKLLHPDDRDRVMAEVARTQATGDPFRCEYRLMARDGGVVWIRDEDVTILGEDGNALYAQGYMLDITARKEVESALEESLARERAANEHLRELDRLKDEFIALVSHELRTPLTSIRGYLEFLLEESDRLEPDHARFLRIVERNAERLQHLVNDLLFVAQVDAGRLTIEHEQVDLAALAADAVEAARVVAAAEQIELALEAEPFGPLAGDRARLAQLLDNLISNAIKFTREGGRVDVRTWGEDGEARFSIADAGIGIPADEQTRLFERFYRASSATEQAIPGTGLGLAIAKAIVDAHGGTISVESTVGVGTIFTVAIPLAAALDERREAA